jgi:hypothetical protein
MTQECRLRGIKVRSQQESRFFCIKATNSEFLRSMFYFSINYQQNVSESNLDHITRTLLFDSLTKVSFLNYDVGQTIESP